jgi:hypothetical protein
MGYFPDRERVEELVWVGESAWVEEALAYRWVWL